MKRFVGSAVLLACTVLASGCVKVLPYNDSAREVARSEVALSPNHATLVIYQSKGVGVPFWIVSNHGQVVAQTRRATHTIAEVPAGALSLYAIPSGYKDSFRARIDGETFEDIVWSYSDPVPECPKIKDLMCFYNENVEAIHVDGSEVERPTTPWSKT